MILFLFQIVISLFFICLSTYLLIRAMRQKKKITLLYSGIIFIIAIVTVVTAITNAAKKGVSKAEKFITKHTATDTSKRTTGYGLLAEYDIDKPDTKANRERFEDYLKIPATEDVKEVYCYADFMGADYTIQMPFNCDTSTLSKIIAINSLSPDSVTSQGINLAREFNWWNEKLLDTIPYFTSIKENELYKYLWFDSSAGKAYYLEFSL